MKKGPLIDIRGGWHVFIRLARACLNELDQLLSTLPEVSGEKHLGNLCYFSFIF